MEESAHNHKFRYILLITSILFVLCLLLLTGCGSSQSPVEIARDFMMKASLGDYEDAYDMFCEASKEEISLEEMSGESEMSDIDKILKESRNKEQIEEAKGELSKMSFELGEQGSSEAVVYITHRDYPLSYHTISLIREGNEWKIDFANSTLLISSRESALEKSCMANMRKIESAARIFSAANEGTYPTSWDDLVPEYISPEDKSEPYCPLDGAEYIIEWSAENPPVIKCPNHGLVQWDEGTGFE